MQPEETVKCPLLNYVVDAVDRMSVKAMILDTCRKNQIPVVTVGGRVGAWILPRLKSMILAAAAGMISSNSCAANCGGITVGKAAKGITTGSKRSSPVSQCGFCNQQLAAQPVGIPICKWTAKETSARPYLLPQFLG